MRPLAGPGQKRAFPLYPNPTSASWLNQVEIWFSILASKALQGASFHSLDALKAHIDSFIENYNQTAHPFAWTKSEVHQKHLKPRFKDL